MSVIIYYFSFDFCLFDSSTVSLGVREDGINSPALVLCIYAIYRLGRFEARQKPRIYVILPSTKMLCKYPEKKSFGMESTS